MTNKTNPRLFLDIHVVQTVPPANINRDDTGSPKTAQYGGVTRARVSSQCWKRAIRKYFLDNGDRYEVGIRSRDIPQYIAEKIRKKDESLTLEQAISLVEKNLRVATKKGDNEIKFGKDHKLEALFFISHKQADKFAQACLDIDVDKEKLEKALKEELQKDLNEKLQKALNKDPAIDKEKLQKDLNKKLQKVLKEKLQKALKEKLQEPLKENPTIDIDLFGRMLANDPSLNVDASAQVAHAISTHAVESEFDFYTAVNERMPEDNAGAGMPGTIEYNATTVDDLAPEDNAGAGMLGTIEYNAATLYRYANVSLHEFYKQLNKNKEETIKAVKLFVRAFVNSMPTGKINSFANQTLPQAVIVSLRADRPINLVSAFEKPVQSENGYVNKSIQKLFEEYTKCEKILEQPVFTDYLLLTDKLEVAPIGKYTANLSELLSDLEKAITENLTDGDQL